MTRTQLNVVIVDDEKPAISNLLILLKSYPQLQVVKTATNGKEAVDAINNLLPEIILLDIQLPDMNGFDVINQLNRNVEAVIVFVTAYDDFAIKAFEVQALDYLLKPYSDQRFFEVIQRAIEHVSRKKIEEKIADLTTLKNQYLSKDFTGTNSLEIEGFQKRQIALKVNNKTEIILNNDIEWIKADDQYSQIFTKGKSILVRYTLSNILTKLDDAFFCRVHRSSAVNIAQVKELIPVGHGDYEIKLKSGVRLRVARTRVTNLKKKLHL